jgi:regulator of replication initiation timing
MIINELDINELNLPLLLLSSGETLKNTIRLLVRATIFPESKLKKYLRLIYIINYKEVHQMSEMQSFLPESVKENIRLAIEDVGLKEVIESIGVEKVIKAVGLEEVIKAVGIKKVESILQKLKKNK